MNSAPNYKYRISNAAVGKILTAVMTMTRSSEIATSQFHDMMFATLNYIESETAPEPTANINPLKWQIIKEMIDKAARRSKAARERAAKRRQSLIASSRHEVGESLSDSTDLQMSSRSSPAGEGPVIRRETPEEKAERERNMQIARDFKEICRHYYGPY